MVGQRSDAAAQGSRGPRLVQGIAAKPESESEIAVVVIEVSEATAGVKPMEKNKSYYLALDLAKLARKVPHDKDARGQSVAFQELLIALVLRWKSEPFTNRCLS